MAWLIIIFVKDGIFLISYLFTFVLIVVEESHQLLHQEIIPECLNCSPMGDQTGKSALGLILSIVECSVLHFRFTLKSLISTQIGIYVILGGNLAKF